MTDRDEHEYELGELDVDLDQAQRQVASSTGAAPRRWVLGGIAGASVLSLGLFGLLTTTSSADPSTLHASLSASAGSLAALAAHASVLQPADEVEAETAAQGRPSTKLARKAAVAVTPTPATTGVATPAAALGTPPPYHRAAPPLPRSAPPPLPRSAPPPLPRSAPPPPRRPQPRPPAQRPRLLRSPGPRGPPTTPSPACPVSPISPSPRRPTKKRLRPRPTTPTSCTTTIRSPRRTRKTPTGRAVARRTSPNQSPSPSQSPKRLRPPRRPLLPKRRPPIETTRSRPPTPARKTAATGGGSWS